MHCSMPDVVRVLVNRLQLLRCVVVVHAYLCIVGCNNDPSGSYKLETVPLLSGDEAGTANRCVCNFELLDERLHSEWELSTYLSVEVEDIDVSRVEAN